MNFIKGRKYKVDGYNEKFTIVATDNKSEGRIVEIKKVTKKFHVLNHTGDWNTLAFTLLPLEKIKFKLLTR